VDPSAAAIGRQLFDRRKKLQRAEFASIDFVRRISAEKKVAR